MGIVHITCPHCQSSFDTSVKKEFIFCQECGTKISISEHIQKEYTYNYNSNVDDKHTLRKEDAARIREADVTETIRLRELEIELIKLQDESRRKKFSMYIKFGVIAACILVIAMLIISITLVQDGAVRGACFLLAIVVVILTAIIIPKLLKN